MYCPVRLVRPLHRLQPHNSRFLAATAARRCYSGWHYRGWQFLWLWAAAIPLVYNWTALQRTQLASWLSVRPAALYRYSSLLFHRQCPCSCDSKHTDCRGDGPDRMW